MVSRPVTSLGHQEGRRVFWEGPKFFELCPVILNDVQYVFPREAKIFLGGASPPCSPLVTGLMVRLVIIPLAFSFRYISSDSRMISIVNQGGQWLSNGFNVTWFMSRQTSNKTDRLHTTLSTSTWELENVILPHCILFVINIIK